MPVGIEERRVDPTDQLRGTQPAPAALSSRGVTLYTDLGSSPNSPVAHLLSFREDVAIESDSDGNLTILSRWGEVQVEAKDPAIDEVLRRMTLGPIAVSNVSDLNRPALYELLGRLSSVIAHSLGIPSSPMPLLSVTPISARAEFVPPQDLRPTQPVRLSRFAFIREVSGVLAIESAISRYRVILHQQLAMSTVTALSRPTTVNDIARSMKLSQEVVTEIIRYLAACDIVVFGDFRSDAGQAVFGEDTDPTLAIWSPQDLFFHSRSRLGRQDSPVGLTFRNAGSVPPFPIVKRPPVGPRVALHRPDLGAPEVHEMSLTTAIEIRRSVREFAETGPTVEKLGELLFRAARVRSRRDVAGTDWLTYSVSARPYPSAGSLYELELYVTVDRCQGLSRGIYHYDPSEHALTLINEDSAQLEKLLDDARVLIGSSRWPPVLITITARVGRLSRFYDGLSYATVLKHVGVLQQTLYLVATSIGLGSCALAIGDDEVASDAFDIEWPSEVSVGELVVGLPSAVAVVD